MIAVIFEVEPDPAHRQAYLDSAAALRAELAAIDGFVSVERYASLSRPERILSLSFWRDENAVRRWRNLAPHRRAQSQGRQGMFRDYRLRVAEVVRDYGLRERAEVPADAPLDTAPVDAGTPGGIRY